MWDTWFALHSLIVKEIHKYITKGSFTLILVNLKSVLEKFVIEDKKYYPWSESSHDQW